VGEALSLSYSNEMTMTISDNTISNVIKGDQRSAKEIYNLCLPYVYTILIRYNVDDSLKKDLLQEIFSNVFKCISKFDSAQGPFKFWMRKIAVNHILKHFNKKKLHFENLEDHTQQSKGAALADSKLNIADITAVLSKMPQSMALVFNLFAIEGFSSKEISEQLNINPATVRTQVRRGREWAKQALSEGYGKTEFNDNKTSTHG